MSAPTLTTEPATLRAGDTANWLLSLPDYPAGDGWSVEYALINASGKITIASTAEGNAHRIHVAAATTAGWTAGTYIWQRRVSNGTDATTDRTGSIDILPDFAALVAIDARTHAQKTLAAIEAWIENHDPGVAEYEIAGRRMKYIPVADLLKLRDQYRREVRGASGKSGRVYVRF